MEYDKLILNSHNKAKTTWDIINKESGRNKKRNEIQVLLVEDKKITNQQTITEIFNEYFISIANNINRQSINNLTNDNNNNTENHINRQSINNSINDSDGNMDSHIRFMEQAFNKPYLSMEYKFVTTREIERIVKFLKTKSSYGYDEISTKILKISSPFITSPLPYICNKMLFWGVFSDRLKYAIIRPIHKNNDTCEISNYRPITL
jgi:hypothetical protein